MTADESQKQKRLVGWLLVGWLAGWVGWWFGLSVPPVRFLLLGAARHFSFLVNCIDVDLTSDCLNVKQQVFPCKMCV